MERAEGRLEPHGRVQLYRLMLLNLVPSQLLETEHVMLLSHCREREWVTGRDMPGMTYRGYPVAAGKASVYSDLYRHLKNMKNMKHFRHI